METLRKALIARLKGAKKIAVLGIGSDLRGDDAAGVMVAESVSRKTRSPRLKVYIGSTAPENLTGEIRKFKPSHLVMIDTAELKGKPGAIFILRPEDFGDAVSFSTHKMPAKVLIDYFLKSFKCSFTLIGIQPKSIGFGDKISRPVRNSIKEVADSIVIAAKKRDEIR